MVTLHFPHPSSVSIIGLCSLVSENEDEGEGCAVFLGPQERERNAEGSCQEQVSLDESPGSLCSGSWVERRQRQGQQLKCEQEELGGAEHASVQRSAAWVERSTLVCVGS